MRKLFIFLLIVFIISSCGNNDQTPAKADTTDTTKVVMTEPAKPVLRLDPDDTVFTLVKTIILTGDPVQYSYTINSFKVFLNGNILYTNYGNDSLIRIADSTGKIIRAFGTKGKADSAFSDYTGALGIGPEGEIYVDGSKSSIKVYDSLGHFMHAVKIPGAPGQFSSGLMVNSSGELMITLTSLWAIRKFDAPGNFKEDMKQIKSGSKEDVWGSFGDIGSDSAGNIYVMNSHTDHDVVVHKCGPDGSYISSFRAKEPTQFGPMAVDIAGRIFMGNDDGVTVYSNNGRKLAFIPQKGASWNDRVRTICVDSHGYVYLLCNDKQLKIYR